jgi:hypothetical protein
MGIRTEALKFLLACEMHRHPTSQDALTASKFVAQLDYDDPRVPVATDVPREADPDEIRGAPGTIGAQSDVV